MKIFNQIVLSISFLVLLVSNSKASHVPGGNVTYQCVGPNQYLVTLTLYEDCGSAFEANGIQTIQINNDCGFPVSSATLNNVVYQQEVSQLCPSQLPSSECAGGNLPGVWMHQWTGLVTLPGPCDAWTFSYSSCCRNTSNNLSTQDSYYWEANLYSATAPCNTSAQITAQPIPYVCANQLVSFNMSAFDADGNTLVYSFIPAMTTGPGTSVTYAGGFSAAVPIPGITIDANTGQITFTPTVTGNYVVAVLIEEYDANGNLVGTIVQDYQFEVINCAANSVPQAPVAGVTNFTGGGNPTGPNSIQVCEGDSFCFDLIFTDPDPGSILTGSSNIASIFPGAVVNMTGSNPLTFNVCYTVQPGDPSLSTISFAVEDNNCPIPGIINYPISVSVINSTYAGPDEIMCLGVGTQLTGSGGTSFNWSVISGDPITPANFSCTNCANPTANPAFTTSYEVVSNLSGGCVNVDTVTVTVVPDFTYTLTQSSGTSCLQDPVQIDIVPNPAGAYTYSWTPGTYLSSTTVPNPTVNATSPGTFTYDVTITSAAGCVHTDQVTVTVAPYYVPTPTASASVINVPCGGTSVLDVDLGGGVPATCGASLTGLCPGGGTPMVSGTQSGVNTTTGYPAIFGNWYWSSRTQMIFTAAELNAMGFVGGKISRIDVPVTQINGASSYGNFVVKMGCTNLTSLATGPFVGGLTQVFGPQTVNVVVGQNAFNFTLAYEWDGVSNLIVEFCGGNNSYTSNCISPYTTTVGNLTHMNYEDNATVCGNTGLPMYNDYVGNLRPLLTFYTCPTVPDPNDFTFAWTPASTLNNATIQSPTATPVNPSTTYNVTVTNINGGCTGTSSVTVLTDCPTCAPPMPVGVNPTCNGGNDGSITATPQGTTGPFTLNWYDVNNNLIQTTTNVTTNDMMTGLSAGVYTIESIDTAGCTNDTTFTLTEPDLVVVTASADQTICINGTATISATATGGDGNYTFTWDNAFVGASQPVTPATNSCFVVDAIDGNGCPTQTTDQVCVNLNPPLTLTVSNDTLICPNSPVTFTANVSGGDGGPYNYVWTNGAGTTVSNTSSLSPATTVDDVFCVTVTDGCTTPSVNDCVNLTLAPVPVPTFVGDNLNGCYPVPVTFTDNTNPADVSSVSWSFGDGNSSVQNGNVSYTYTNPGCYDVTLTVTSPNGCVSATTLTDYICVYDYPVAAFIAGPQPTDLFNSTVTFVNTSINAISSEWDFAGLDSSNLTNPSFTFPSDNPDSYIVTLVVSNTDGCTDTTSQTIIINGIFTMYVPNAFTPDGDNINDILMPVGDGVDATGYEFTIFNRWGEQVFSTTQLGVGWNGTENGVRAPNDVYVWRIKGKSVFDGAKHEFFGHSTLIR